MEVKGTDTYEPDLHFLNRFGEKKRTAQGIIFYLFNIVFIIIYLSMIQNGYELDFVETVLFMPILIAAFGFILYMLAKRLTDAEKTRHLGTQSVFIYMLLFLILPIGVWILIPQFRLLKAAG